MDRALDFKKSRQTFLYKLLIDPHYRAGRHLVFILAITAIAMNQVLNAFHEYYAELKNELYLISLIMLTVYLAVGYFNLYVLVPRYLLKKKYAKYIINFILLMAVFLWMEYLLEYCVNVYFDLLPGAGSYVYPFNILWLDLLSTFLVNCACFGGSVVTIVMKDWIINNQRISELENEQVKSEVTQLKEQVTPDFLFTVLHRIGVLTQSNQAQASDMLMELSELLRYQLYDCSREKVLLNAEIRFLANYLTLEQLHAGDMEFEIRIKGDVNRIFVPPLLFIPFVQQLVPERQGREGNLPLQIGFESGQDSVQFYCHCFDPFFLQNPGLDKIKQRLERLLGDRYSLQMGRDDTGRDYIMYLQLYM